MPAADEGKNDRGVTPDAIVKGLGDEGIDKVGAANIVCFKNPGHGGVAAKTPRRLAVIDAQTQHIRATGGRSATQRAASKPLAH
jgi:hypothetical protein